MGERLGMVLCHGVEMVCACVCALLFPVPIHRMLPHKPAYVRLYLFLSPLFPSVLLSFPSSLPASACCWCRVRVRSPEETAQAAVVRRSQLPLVTLVTSNLEEINLGALNSLDDSHATHHRRPSVLLHSKGPTSSCPARFTLTSKKK